MMVIIFSATNTRALAPGLRQPAHRIGRLAHRIGWGAQAIRRTEIVLMFTTYILAEQQGQRAAPYFSRLEFIKAVA